MAMEALEAQRLLKEMTQFCSYKLRTMLAFDDVSDLTETIINLPEDETRNFIRGYINPDKSKQKQLNSFINELLSKKRKYNSLIEKENARKRVVEAAPLQEGFVVYQKDRGDSVPPGIKKKKSKRDKKSEKNQRQMDNKEPKFIRKPCDCQALIHPLINNCLKCGKIICAKEGEGPCLFCGAAKAASETSNEIDKATAHRDKLIAYERDTKVTKVYDDQADHFDFQGNQWLSENEKALLKKRQEDIDAKIKEDQRKIVVTFDLAGRQIIQDESGVVPDDGLELDYYDQPPTEKKAGTFQNPFLAAKPSFRKSNRSRPKDFLQSEGIKQKSGGARKNSGNKKKNK